MYVGQSGQNEAGQSLKTDRQTDAEAYKAFNWAGRPQDLARPMCGERGQDRSQSRRRSFTYGSKKRRRRCRDYCRYDKVPQDGRSGG